MSTSTTKYILFCLIIKFSLLWFGLSGGLLVHNASPLDFILFQFIRFQPAFFFFSV